MDANGTRFHLLLGHGDWGSRCESGGLPLSAAFTSESGIGWDEARQEVTLGARVTVIPAAPGNRPPLPEARRGAAADAYGNLYSIAADERGIVVGPSPFWPPAGDACEDESLGAFRPCAGDGDAEALTLRGLTVTSDGYLVAGVVNPGPGLLVFDLLRGGAPRRLLWPVAFAPFDFAATPDGGVVILDADNRRVWQLDRTFAVVAPWVQPAAPPPPLFRPKESGGQAILPVQDCLSSTVTLDHSFEVAGVNATEPFAIEVMSDGSVLILDRHPAGPFSRVLRYQDGRRTGNVLDLDPGSLVDEVNFSLIAHDFVYLPERTDAGETLRDLLYVVAAGGDQAFVFALTATAGAFALKALPELVSIRLFGGRGLAAASGNVLYDLGEQWLPLVPQRRGRYAEEGTFVVTKLDGKQPGCVWHRLFLDACIPSDCEIAVATRASDDEALLPFAERVEEPALVRRSRGSELPWATATLAAGIDTWELLFQKARGRYLRIEITLRGTGRSTPRLRALRAYYPRFSYLDRYLPAIYRENADSARFLDRFLALFESFFTSTEDRIAAVQMLFDDRSSPSEALDWLAGWFGVAFDREWSDEKRRLFIRRAVDFFEWRGTPSGLLAALRLVLDDCPDESIFDFGGEPPRTGVRVVESFRRRPPSGLPEITPEQLNPTDAPARLARPSPLPSAAHRFSVFVPRQPGSNDPRRLELARRIVELEKPAHAVFDVDYYWSWFRLGEARLGEDTVVDLGSRSPALFAPFQVGRTRIGAAWLAPAAAGLAPGRTIVCRSCSGESR